MKKINDYLSESLSRRISKNDPYYNHALNYLLGLPGYTKSKAEKYLDSLSDNEIEKLAHKDM